MGIKFCGFESGFFSLEDTNRCLKLRIWNWRVNYAVL